MSETCPEAPISRILLGTVLGSSCDGEEIKAGITAIATCKNLSEVKSTLEQLIETSSNEDAASLEVVRSILQAEIDALEQTVADLPDEVHLVSAEVVSGGVELTMNDGTIFTLEQDELKALVAEPEQEAYTEPYVNPDFPFTYDGTTGGALDAVSDYFNAQFGDVDEPVIILNNPKLYVRTATGDANPLVESQEDLTEANAFKDLAGVKRLLRRSNVVGDVTIDVRGTITEKLYFNAAEYKSSSKVTVCGDPADPTAFKLEVSTNGTGGSTGGVRSNYAGVATLKDVNIVADQRHETNYNFFPIYVTGNLNLDGEVLVTGFMDYEAHTGNGLVSAVGEGVVNFVPKSTFKTAFSAGTKILNFIGADGGGTVNFLANTLNNNTQLTVDKYVYSRGSSAVLIRAEFDSAIGQFVQPEFSGVDVDANSKIYITGLSALSSSRVDDLLNDFDYNTVSSAAIVVDEYSRVDNTYGSQINN